MPKRSDDYMRKQRDQIARAALMTMLDKGLHDTSLRDISEAAGVSLGALYVHFSNKEDLILEVCRHPSFPLSPPARVTRWSDYEDSVRYLKVIHQSPVWRQRIRLSLEFAAHVGANPNFDRGAHAVLQTRVDWHAESLKTLHDKGEIALPLDLDRTARACHRLVTGAWYVMAADGGLDIDREIDMLLAALKALAGRGADPADREPVATDPRADRAPKAR